MWCWLRWRCSASCRVSQQHQYLELVSMACRVQHSLPAGRLQVLQRGRVLNLAPPCRALESYMVDKLEGTIVQFQDVQVISLPCGLFAACTCDVLFVGTSAQQLRAMLLCHVDRDPHSPCCCIRLVIIVHLNVMGPVECLCSPISVFSRSCERSAQGCSAHALPCMVHKQLSHGCDTDNLVLCRT